MLFQRPSMPRAVRLWATVMVCVLHAEFVEAQGDSGSSTEIKSPAQRLSELEKRVKDLEEEVGQLEKEKAEAETQADQPFFADGVLTVGGVEFRLGGRAELWFIDVENETDPRLAEDTDRPEPYVELHRLRLVPRLRFNRHVDARGQIDFSPERGRVRLKEFTARHRVRPVWWFRSNFEVGLDDRVIRPARRTRNYPLVGNAIWRDESLGAVWSFRFGHRLGRPKPDAEDIDAAEPDSTDEEAIDHLLRAENVGELFEAPVDPFDFASNWGAATLHVSGGQGHVLGTRRIGFDRASFNDIVQDDRSVDDDLTLSEVGVALDYQRDFDWLGEFQVMGFFYHNTLSDDSVAFLQGTGMNVFDPSGTTWLYGYGNTTDKRESWRYGFGAEYFLPARTLFGDIAGIRQRDGLRVQGQWIKAEDGDFNRRGWYVQASYRYSFPERLIAGRYFRSIEPLVRYGELNTNLGPFVELPTTWDRERLLVGLIVDVTNEILFRVEYAFNSEDTGDDVPGPTSVDNDEFLVELMLLF